MRALGAIVAVLVVAALGLAGVALLQESLAAGESLVPAFALLVVPLLGVGVIVVAVVAAIVPPLRYGHDNARAVVAIIVAVVLGAGVYGLVGDVRVRRPDVAVTSAVGVACSGRAVPAAGILNTGGSVRNHLVVLDATGAELDWTGKPDLTWRPPSVDDTELVACVDREDTFTELETCRYEPGPDTTRFSATRSVRIVAARSGIKLASFSITNEPSSCPQVKVQDLEEMKADGVSWEQLSAHLASLVRDGHFVDPDASASGEEPGASEEPGAGEEPGASDEPLDQTRSVTLQKAIAGGLVTAKGTGNGLQSLDLDITSKASETLDVAVPAGTYLDPGAKATQSMIVIAPMSARVVPGRTVTLDLDVACGEMHDGQPSDTDHFTVRAKAASGDLARLVAGTAFGEADFRLQQFAIWTITSNPTTSGYVALGSFGVGSGPDAGELREIKAIFKDAGIDPTKYKALK